MKKVIFISVIVSPFQIELNNKINEQSEIDFSTVFTKTSYKGRGKHWNSYINHNAKILIIDVQSKIAKIKSLYNTLKANKPDLIVIGQIRGLVPAVSRYYAWKNNVPFIFWLEQPFPKKNMLYKTLKYIDCYVHLLGCKNVIGIGNRAVNYYSKFSTTSMIPYSQDLNFINKEYINNQVHNTKISFLFSGQLILRHNIDIIVNAIEMLYDDIGNNFKFTFAAKGELKYLIDELLSKRSEINEVIGFDSDYKEWNDRLIPFYYSDVLVYPSNHSGWGLVVPEALACGLMVISTRQVESARYFIDNNENGVFIGESVIDLYKSMKKCVLDKEGLKSMINKALVSYEKGDVTTVVPQLINHFIKSIEN